jgi:hypothetical protein
MKKYKYFLLTSLTLVLTVLLLTYFGQPVFSKTGNIYLYWFAGGVEDSQQFFDWYSFSHIIHGLLFFFLFTFVINFLNKKFKFNLNTSFSIKLFLATLLEAGWELLENSPIIIERYRQSAIANGYFGDSVFNSFSDLLCMIFGFYFSYKFGWKVALCVIIFFELFTLYFIRDNLTLNVIMLLYPSEAISAWQIGA